MSNEKFNAWAVRNAENHVVGIYAEKRDAEQVKGQWGVEIIELVEKDTQAAANKAAEEGELPMLPEEEFICEPGIYGHTADQMSEYARQAIASDRASRQDEAKTILRDMLAIQAACDLHTDEYAPGSVIEYIKELEAESAARPVANKAEVEPVAHLKFWARQSWSGNGNHDVEHAEGLEVCEAGEIGDDGEPAFPVYATPPATTGASTAPVETFIELRNRVADLESQLAECMRQTAKWAAAAGEADGRNYKAREVALEEAARHFEQAPFDQAKVAMVCSEIRALKGSVGASTVLTDERFEVMHRLILDVLTNHRMVRMFEVEEDGLGNSYPLIDRLCPDDEIDLESGRVEADAIAWAIADKLSETDIFAREVSAQAGQVAVPEAATQEMITAGKNAWACNYGMAIEEIYSAMIAAAPSPAKESK